MTVNIYDENNNVTKSVAITAEDFDSEIPTFEVMVLDDHIDFGQYIAGYSLRSAGNTETLVATYAYDANGNRTSLTYANGTTTTYAYNKANLVTSVVNKKGNTTLSSHTYTYYLDGNIASENENGTTKTYEYDGLGRLTKETRNGTITVYTYDLNGNRATMTQNGVTTTYEYDANNRLLKETVAGAVTSYDYDANGNLINAWSAGNPVGAYAYNLFGNQISFTADSIVYTNYTYRPDGLRHSIGDKVHIWDGANIVADVDDGDITVYVRGINLIYADDGSRTYYHFNAHGDVVALTNESGTKTKSYSYNAFGVEYNEATLDDNPFRYCGEYYDKETKTIYLRARYYNSAQGRFTQEDPIRDGLNWYAYCGGNPVMFIDPTGKTVKDFIAGLTFSLDDGMLGGFAQWFTETLADDYLDYTPEDEVDYYTGRVFGDLLSMATGIVDIYNGLQMIHSALTNGLSVFVASEGTLVVQGVAIVVAGTVAGTAVVAYGTTKIVAASSNLGSDLDSLQNALKERKSGISKQESPIWNNLDYVKGKSYKSSGEKKNRKYYEWDHLHNEIEVYDRHGNHLGAMDPVTGEMIKPPKKGRSIDVR